MDIGGFSELLPRHGRICVLYSGGFDSQVLLRACAASAGTDRILALTAHSPLLAAFYRELITDTVSEFKIEHTFVEVDILNEGNFTEGGSSRCYLCKKAMFRELGKVALENGCAVIMDGTLCEDLLKDRPGLRAAREEGIMHPFVLAGMDASAVAEMGFRLGADPMKLPSDSCLATRIPHGRKITAELLRTVEMVESPLRSRVRGRLRARIDKEDIVLDYSPEDEDTVLKMFPSLKETARGRGMSLRLNCL